MRRVLIIALSVALSGLTALSARAHAAATAAGGYVAVTPHRLAVLSFAGYQTRTVTAGGHAGVPSTGVSAVAMTITVSGPTAAGRLIAWPYGSSYPSATTTVTFSAGQRITEGAIVKVDSAGRMSVHNTSAKPISLWLDVTGYLVAGSPATAGAYHALAPARVVDTTKGTDGNRKGALTAGHGFTALLGGHGGVPSTGVASVALTLTVTAPTASGALLAYAYGATRPADAVLHFRTGVATSAFAVVAAASGRISLVNTAASGSVQVAVDVVGWFASGVPTSAGAVVPLAPTTIARATLPAHGGIGVHTAGVGGVAMRNVRAVLVTLTVASPTAAGALVVWPAGTSRPSVSSLQFPIGVTSSTTELAGVSSAGTIDVYNVASTSVRLAVDVVGYVRADTIAAPATAIGRYPRNFTGTLATDMATLHAEGQQDAGKRFVLLDVGAQGNDKLGVVPSNGSGEISYADLVSDLQAYLDGFGDATAATTVAVGTNNDANDWTTYTGTARGKDWADKVVDKLHGGSNVTVVGADDIESNFFSTQAQAQAWVNGYLGATGAGLVFNGSADGCPTTYGSNAGCEFGWTLQQYYALAHQGARVQVLPQIYNAAQAVQWANIDRAGGGALIFAGSLTEHGVDSSTFTAAQGWAALHNSIATVSTAPNLPAAVDLHVDS